MKLPVVDGFILWLLPDKESERFFSQVIEDLANRYHSYTFKPHVTISKVPNWKPEQIINAIDRISTHIPEFDVPVKQVNCRENPHQKISVEIKKTEIFEKLVNELDLIFEGPFSKREYPHLSLHYNTVSCEDLSDEPERLNALIHSNIKLDKLALINLAGNPDEWKVIYSKKLSGQLQF